MRATLEPRATIAERAAPLRQWLEQGGVLAIPTESSYGLAVDPRNPEAVAEVYRLKGRPAAMALPVVAADLAQLHDLGIDTNAPEVRWLAEHWPAPLTAVLPVAKPLPAAPDKATLAVRIPAQESLRVWLRVLGPLTATSANRSGSPASLDADELTRQWPGDVAILDGGTLPGGSPSTLILWTADKLEILRPGRYPIDGLAAEWADWKQGIIKNNTREAGC